MKLTSFSTFTSIILMSKCNLNWSPSSLHFSTISIFCCRLIALPQSLKMVEPAAKRYVIPGLLPVSINAVCTTNINRPIQAKQGYLIFSILSFTIIAYQSSNMFSLFSISKTWSEAARSWFLRIAEGKRLLLCVFLLNTFL